MFSLYKYYHLTLDLNSKDKKSNDKKRGIEIKAKVLKGSKSKWPIFIGIKNIFKS